MKSFFIIFSVLVVISVVIFYTNQRSTPNPSKQKVEAPKPTKDETFRTYVAPDLEKNKREYQIFMVGDSMTYALGPHGGKFYEFINAKYKPHNIGILVDNYASSSTNILSLPTAMTTKTTYWDATFEPLLTRQFDLILIESFGYNPLSQYPRDEGLKKQREMLDQTMKTLIVSHPKSRIVFVATIAPNKTKYALPKNSTTTLADRTAQVEEREAFIKNHIAYANEHNIPVINIYEKSLTPEGDGNLKYINSFDYIHPSFEGVDFISNELANYIYDNQIIPHK